MNDIHFGVNLSFAVKRWPEAEAWARLVRETLGLDLVQFTFDLVDPWWPDDLRNAAAAEVRATAAAWGIEIHSAFVGLANYTYNGLLHPHAAGRRAGLEWWRRAIDLAAELGAGAVGGPLGGMSVHDATDPNRRTMRYQELLGDVVTMADWCAAAGLQQILVEPTPLTREFPHTVTQASALLADLSGRTAVPVRYVLDIGHALFQPLYGPGAALQPWLEHLHAGIGMFHLQNTDFQSDSHWGWPDALGAFDVVGFGRLLDQASMTDRPIFLEVFYPFEWTDEQVFENIRTSVTHCRAALATATS